MVNINGKYELEFLSFPDVTLPPGEITTENFTDSPNNASSGTLNINMTDQPSGYDSPKLSQITCNKDDMEVTISVP